MSVQAAKEVIPQPVIVDAVCDVDIPSRTIAVRLSELVEGHGRRLWREAHAALVRAEEGGYRSGPPILYASAPGAYRVAHAVPDRFGVLLFRFPQGVSAFSELVGKPRLVAWVGIDVSSGNFISVTFRHAT